MIKLAILLAAGKGSRMGSDIPKQYMKVHGKPLFLYALQTFLESGADEIALVVAKGDEDYVKSLLPDRDFGKRIRIIAGGSERFMSVYYALCAYRDREVSVVAVHDGARPAISKEVIERSMEDAKRYGASVVAVQSKDTVKLADEDGFVRETPQREAVYIVQTPQCFDFRTLLSAYDMLMSDERLQAGITDDAMVVERVFGTRVKITMGEYGNIKVTTKEDLVLAESVLSGRIE